MYVEKIGEHRDEASAMYYYYFIVYVCVYMYV